MKRIGLFGCGKLNHIVAKCYLDGLLEGYEIVGCFSKTLEHREEMSKLLNIKRLDSFDDLLALNLDYLVEATNPSATKEILIKTLNAHVNVILLSIGALADKAYFEEVKKVASQNEVKVHLAHGAIAGFELLQTASLMNPRSVSLTNLKGVSALRGKSIYKEEMEVKEMNAFNGSALKAIEELPTGINVGVATALASIGVDKTKIIINSKPDFLGDDQRIDIDCGPKLCACLDVYSATSDIAGYSVVSLLRNLNSSVVF